MISSCAQTLYVLKILSSHGMDNSSLQISFRSIVVAKLQYASSAWYGFASPTEIQQIDAFINCCKSSDVCARQLMKNYSKESYATHIMFYTGIFLLQLSHRKTITFIHENITLFFQIELVA